MKLLEIFSGTGSVGGVARDLCFEVVSLDFKNVGIICDRNNSNYKDYPVGYFDFVWAVLKQRVCERLLRMLTG